MDITQSSPTDERNRGKAPVFVVGAPRSGSTLLYHMILSAGGFAVYLDETHIFSLFAPHCGSLDVRTNRKRLAELWLQSFYFRLTGLDPHELRDRMVEECCNAGDCLRLTMESILQMQGVERWAEHTPEHVLYLRDIKRTIPEALIIHIIRDGRERVYIRMCKRPWEEENDPWPSIRS